MYLGKLVRINYNRTINHCQERVLRPLYSFYIFRRFTQVDIDFILDLGSTMAWLAKVGFFTVGSLYLFRRTGGALRGLLQYQKKH